MVSKNKAVAFGVSARTRPFKMGGGFSEASARRALDEKRGDDDSATGILILLKESLWGKMADWNIWFTNWLQAKIGIWIVVSYCKFGWLQGFLTFMLKLLLRETSICVMCHDITETPLKHLSTILCDSSWRSLILGFDSEEVYGIVSQFQLFPFAINHSIFPHFLGPTFLLVWLQECLGKYNHSLLAAFQRMHLGSRSCWFNWNFLTGFGQWQVRRPYWTTRKTLREWYL